MVIREATGDDVPHLIELSKQLGYESDPAQFERRFMHVTGFSDHFVLVAHDEVDDHIMGFMHIRTHESLILPAIFEIAVLVVDECKRGKGVGQAFITEAQMWATRNGFENIQLTTNITRTDTHKFYEKHGFEKLKTQHVYRKYFPQASQAIDDG